MVIKVEFTDEMWKNYAYVLSSKYRQKALKCLGSNAKVPTQIARESGIRTNHISKTLKELNEHELIECINPEARKGRLYRITDKGKEISKNLDSNGKH